MFKIYNYTKNSNPIDFNNPPFDIDYTILGLHRKKNKEKGELKTIEYYGEYDGTIYSELIVKETRTYYRVNRMLNRREMIINWYCDGDINYSGGTVMSGDTIGAINHVTKYYTPEESIAAGEKRRRSIISNMKIATLYLLQAAVGMTRDNAEASGFQFLGEISSNIGLYIEGILEPLKNSIMTNSNYTWLDSPINAQGTKVREYLYNEVNINYEENNIYV